MIDAANIRHVEFPLDASMDWLSAQPGGTCVSIGTQLGDADADARRLEALLGAQQRGGVSYPLVTARGTIAAHPPTVRAWVQEHADLRLCLHTPEWILGSEAIFGDARAWRALLREIAPRVDVLVTPAGGSERAGRTRSITAPLLNWLSHRPFRETVRRARARGAIVLSELPHPVAS